MNACFSQSFPLYRNASLIVNRHSLITKVHTHGPPPTRYCDRTAAIRLPPRISGPDHVAPPHITRPSHMYYKHRPFPHLTCDRRCDIGDRYVASLIYIKQSAPLTLPIAYCDIDRCRWICLHAIQRPRSSLRYSVAPAHVFIEFSFVK